MAIDFLAGNFASQIAILPGKKAKAPGTPSLIFAPPDADLAGWEFRNPILE
jgi:hypothetical protein